MRQNCPEQNEIAELWMNHIPVDSHPPEPRSDRHGLMRNDPHLRSPAIRFHGETYRCAVDGADTDSFNDPDNLAGGLVGFVRCVMKFEIGDGARRGSNILAVHENHKANECPCFAEEPKDLRFLVGDLRAVNLDKADIVGTSFETHSMKPLTIQRLCPCALVARCFSRLKFSHRRVITQLPHRSFLPFT